MRFSLPVRTQPGRWPTVLLFTLFMVACASSPERDVPSAQIAATPWGAISTHTQRGLRPPERRYRKALEQRLQTLKAEYPGQKIPIRILALSGGGPMGAYGAGVLSGWTLTGTRPEFDVVTGISVGALMATYAFLGPEYDRQLQKDAFAASAALAKPRTRILAFELDSVFDSRVLQEILEQSITPALLEEVAAAYRQGRRLFVGTTNLESKDFVIWDMGYIASSDNPNKVKLYQDVLLASASVPVVFQPVMIDVDPTETTYQQMHVDGGVRENIFISDYTRDLHRAARAVQLSLDAFKAELYTLYNGKLYSQAPLKQIDLNVLPIASTAIATLMLAKANDGIYQLWLTSMINGIEFNLAHIPPDFEFKSTLTAVDPAEMDDLFSAGFTQALQDKAWFTQQPPETLDELRALIGAETLENAFERSPKLPLAE